MMDEETKHIPGSDHPADQGHEASNDDHASHDHDHGDDIKCVQDEHGHESHSHHAHDVHSTRQEGAKYLLIAMAITGSIVGVEVIGGIVSNSLALLSDAGHVFTDFLALLLSYIAFKFASRPATEKLSWGFYRLEIFAALINSVVLAVITTVIFIEAYHRLMNPSPVEGGLMMVVAVIGLIANLISAKVLHSHSQDNLNIKSAFLHVIADAISSVGVIIAGVAIYFTGYFIIDPILSVILGLVIVRGAYNLGKEALSILMEAVPDEIEVQHVNDDLMAIEGVKEVHHLHLWTISSGIHALSAHVMINDVMTSESSLILETIEDMLREKHSISHVTIQFECESCREGQVCYLALPVVKVRHTHKH